MSCYRGQDVEGFAWEGCDFLGSRMLLHSWCLGWALMNVGQKARPKEADPLPQALAHFPSPHHKGDIMSGKLAIVADLVGF